MPNNKLLNTLKQALKPARFPVMFKKLLRRFFDTPGRHTRKENLDWLESNCSNFMQLATSLDADLWHEAEIVSRSVELHAAKILENIEYKLGGGGAYPFLYFLTRYMEPDCIVETGVAAGFSSYAFLLALKANQRGTLHSSDFPYFRIPDPEKYVGVIIEEKIRKGWNLYLDGDEVNLPKIANAVDQVDIFHYDSDKSYAGRAFALSTISSSLSDRGVIIMDDIQDNSFFYDTVEESNPGSWYVFRFQDKFLGLIGQPTRRCFKNRTTDK